MWTVAQLADWCGGRVIGDAGVRLADTSTVVIDSRKVLSGDLFIALVGPNHDAHDFLPQAIEAGAGACIVSNPSIGGGRVPLIHVDDTQVALSHLAHNWRRQFNLPMAAITGSCGKTTTKEMARAILNRHHSPLDHHHDPLVTEGNLNNHIGLPLTLLRLRPEHHTAVVEMGINHPGEIDHLCHLAEPAVGLITGIGRAHLEGLGDTDGVAAEKGRLFADVAARGGTCVVNLDDPRVVDQAAAAERDGTTGRSGAKLFTYTTRPGVHADLCLTLDPAASKSTESTPHITIDLAGERHCCELFSAAPHQLTNAAAAAALCHVLGANAETIVRGLSAFSLPAMRGQEIQLACGARLIDDTYNANPESVLAALTALCATPTMGRRIAVLGDMLELGDQAPIMHRQLGEFAAAMGLERLVCVGDMAHHMADGADGFPTVVDQVASADQVAALFTDLGPGDLILVKGSRGLTMENAVADLKAVQPVKMQAADVVGNR